MVMEFSKRTFRCACAAASQADGVSYSATTVWFIPVNIVISNTVVVISRPSSLHLKPKFNPPRSHTFTLSVVQTSDCHTQKRTVDRSAARWRPSSKARTERRIRSRRRIGLIRRPVHRLCVALQPPKTRPPWRQRYALRAHPPANRLPAWTAHRPQRRRMRTRRQSRWWWRHGSQETPVYPGWSFRQAAAYRTGPLSSPCLDAAATFDTSWPPPLVAIRSSAPRECARNCPGRWSFESLAVWAKRIWSIDLCSLARAADQADTLHLADRTIATRFRAGKF